MLYRKTMIKYISLTLLLASTVTITGCAPAVVAGGVAAGATVAIDRRTTGTLIEDQSIELKASELLKADAGIAEHSNITIVSYNLQVLLTGQAESDDISRRLADKIATLPRVRKVFNEVVTGAEGTWSEAASDTYLTSRAKVALLDVDIKGFDPTVVKVVTSQGTVFLMGLLTRQEADAVTDKVRYISGVKRVVRLFEYIPAS